MNRPQDSKATWRPHREVEIVAGTPPGGGLDRTARALARAIESARVLDVTLKVVNIPGDGARKAWDYVERYAGEPHLLAVSSPNLTTDRLTGVARFGHSSFTPLAILYNEYIAFVVRSDCAIPGALELLQRFGSRGDAVTVALSTALGNPNHIALAKVIRHAGGEIKVPKLRVFDSALDALADVVAGNAELAAITAASAVDALAAGTVRALAVSSPTRLSGLYAQTPAWAEHSVDCTVGAWRGVTGPRGLTPAQIACWESVFAAALETAAWKADLDRQYWTGMYLAGARLRKYLQSEDAEFQAVLGELGLLRG